MSGLGVVIGCVAKQAGRQGPEDLTDARTEVATRGDVLLGHGEVRVAAAPLDAHGVAEVVALIEAARRRAFQAVNVELVAHYWQFGEYISLKIGSAEWGDGVVEDLAADLARRYPGVRGYRLEERDAALCATFGAFQADLAHSATRFRAPGLDRWPDDRVLTLSDARRCGCAARPRTGGDDAPPAMTQ